MGVAYFLQLSDLHRIPLSCVSISDDNSLLSFEVHDLNEKRNCRQTIKSFTVKSHANSQICPVTTFLAFRSRRPFCTTPTLFFNSVRPSDPFSSRVKCTDTKKLIRLSSNEPRLSLRSITSPLVLQSGIPKKDIVAMANWASSKTFEYHYRREHLSQFDFTNTLVCSSDDLNFFESNKDIFFDVLNTL
ncbi:hypothetical protein A0J61_08664 [Choanephora cucurbitarum]|uniref:Uncharacterized protein n=1 Tax=Choanephora cucurbitarum TaxID=101091 RepID=A0A1C7N2B5_9FUNG|nr:hypothetical protein A0J61_08664 [Choanephora cucurbitarum]